MPARHDLWLDRLRGSRPKHPVGQLYAGEAWSRTSRVVAAACGVGFEPEVWVASAGLGLASVSDEAPAYAATFSPGHADSVGSNRGEVTDWWGRFAQRGGQRLVEVAAGGSTLVILSKTYASALTEDLQQLAAQGGDNLLIGGNREVDGLLRLRSQIGLRSTLGGTASGLNARMAEAWLQGLARPVLTSSKRAKSWSNWAHNVRQPEAPMRQRASDDTVVTFIRQLRLRQPTIGYSAALKQFRGTGRACEQSRFATLFANAVGR